MTSLTPGNCAVEINDLVRLYNGGTDGVNGLTLNVPYGGCYGLFGCNGAGKSTTLKCLLRLLHPQSGQIWVLGFDPALQEDEVKRRVSMVSEAPQFYPRMTVRENLDYCAWYRPRWNRKLEQELMGRFGLERDKLAGALSKGMLAQLALVCALAPEPELLLLDEPTDGLDPFVRLEFLDTVREHYMAAAGRTLLVSTHLMHEWDGLITHFSIINQGRCVDAVNGADELKGWQRLTMKYQGEPPQTSPIPDVVVRSRGSELVAFCRNYRKGIEDHFWTKTMVSLEVEPMKLEEVFIATLRSQKRQP